MRINRAIAAASAAILMGTLAAAPAGAVVTKTFNASLGDLAASATFTNAGGGLTVYLTNTSTADVLVPADVLTALFFNLGTSLTPVDALLNAGSTVFFGPDGGGNVGGEWAYEEGLIGAPGGYTKGISSAGFNLFGSPNFNGVNLQDPAAVNGGNYGITSAGDDTTTGNAKVTGGEALIKNSVVFTFTGNVTDAILNALNRVSFQYGTSLDAPNLDVPIPAAAWLLLSGLGGLGLIGRRRRKVA